MPKRKKMMAIAAVAVAAIVIASVVLVAFVLSPSVQGRPVAFQEVVDKLDIGFVKQVVENITSYGSMTGINGEPLGFRVAGSNASTEATRYVRDQMNAIGLTNVTMEEIPTDSWDIRSAWVDIPGIGKIQAVSHGGSGNTSSSPYASADGSITAEMINVGNGEKADYVSKNASGKIVLCDFNMNLWTNTMGMEAQLHGAIAIVFTTYDNWNTPGIDIGYGLNGSAIVAMDGEYKPSYIPVLVISGNDGRRIIEKMNSTVGNISATVYSDIRIKTMAEGGRGYNLVGYLPGKNWGTAEDEMVIIGDHTDSWFYGAFDNAGGVGGTLALAKAFKEAYTLANSKPNRTIAFITHTGEEWGRFGTYFDWIWGAYYEAKEVHPEWAGKVVGIIIMDFIGLTGEPFGFEVTPELRSFAKDIANDNSARMPYGVEYWAVGTYEDHWPYTAEGIPSIACWTWSTNIDAQLYHTQLDTIDKLDFDYMSDNLVVIADMAFRLANAQLLPYDFSYLGDNLEYEMKDSPIHKVSQLTPIYSKYDVDMNANLTRTLEALENYSELSSQLNSTLTTMKTWDLTEAEQRNYNILLLELAKVLDSSLLSIGVWDEVGYYPYTQSLIDVYYLSTQIDGLASAFSNPAATPQMMEGYKKAITDWVGINWYYDYISETNYREQYNITYGEGMISFGTQQHLRPAVDVWDEVDRLAQMVKNGTIEKPNLSGIISSLKQKLVAQGFANLEKGFETMWTALEEANGIMADFLAST